MSTSVNKIIFYSSSFGAIRMLIGAYSAIYLVSKGISYSDIAYLKIMQSVIILFLDIPMAYFSDTYGRKKCIVAATFFASLWMGLTAYADNVYFIWAGEICNAISLALSGGAFTAILIEKYKKETGSQDFSPILGKLNKYQFIMMALFSFIGGVFVTTSSSLMWWVGSVLLLILCFMSSKLLPSDSNKSKSERTSKKNFMVVIRECIEVTVTNKISFKIILSSSLICSIGYQLIIQYWQLIVESFIEYDKGIIFSLIFVLILLVQSVAGNVLSKDNVNYVRLIMTLQLIIVSLTSINAYYGGNIFVFMPLLMLMFITIRVLSIYLSNLININLNDSIRNTYDSIISTVSKIVLIITLLLVGSLVSFFGINSVIYSSVTLLILSSFLVLRLSEKSAIYE